MRKGKHLNQRSFQKVFLNFDLIQDGVVHFENYKRLYLEVQPINPALMSRDEKEKIIEDISSFFSLFEKSLEISFHAFDKQADLDSQLELIQGIQSECSNTYIRDYLAEIEHIVMEARESGTERLFVLCVSYPIQYESVHIIKEARQLIDLDSIFSIRIMSIKAIKTMFAVYCTRDFSKVSETNCIKAFKNTLTPIQSRFTPTYACIGDLYVQTFIVRKFPDYTKRSILFERLSKIHGVDITIRFNKLEEGHIHSGIDKTLHASRQLFATANKETDKLVSLKKQDALIQMYDRMLSNNEYMYDMSVFIQVKSFNRDELVTLEKRVVRELKMLEFVKETPQFLQKDAWFACAPFGENKIRQLVNRNVPISTASRMMPYVYSGRKDIQGQYIGEDNIGGMIFVDLEKKDFEVTNTNVVILGESGQGKTRLEHLIMLQKYIRGNKLFIEDPEREHSSFVQKLNGTYIQPGGEYMINPMEIFDYCTLESDTIYESGVSKLRQHIGWLTEFFKVYNDAINTDLITILLEQFYSDQGYTFEDKGVAETISIPTLADFYAYTETILCSTVSDNIHLYQKQQLNQLLQQIHGLCVGADSDLCNGHTNMESNAVVAWDLNDLMVGSKRRLRIMQHVISGYVWNQVMKYRYTTKVTYVISELSLRLHKENIESIASIVGMLKRFRKYESDIILSTQNPYDMLREGIREYTAPLFTSPAFRFLFYPGEGDKEQFIKTVNITETEYLKISKSKKGNVLFTAGATKYNIQISGLTDAEQRLFGKGTGL